MCPLSRGPEVWGVGGGNDDGLVGVLSHTPSHSWSLFAFRGVTLTAIVIIVIAVGKVFVSVTGIRESCGPVIVEYILAISRSLTMFFFADNVIIIE